MEHSLAFLTVGERSPSCREKIMYIEIKAPGYYIPEHFPEHFREFSQHFCCENSRECSVFFKIDEVSFRRLQLAEQMQWRLRGKSAELVDRTNWFDRSFHEKCIRGQGVVAEMVRQMISEQKL